jgi:hypothetical protein
MVAGDIVRKIFLRNKCVDQIKHKSNDSPVWGELLKVKDFYMKGS